MQIKKAKVDNILQDLHKSSDYNMKANSNVLLLINLKWFLLWKILTPIDVKFMGCLV